ncbi:MAG TPA: PAS domain S-box protein [Acidimicrobiia bacterium]
MNLDTGGSSVGSLDAIIRSATDAIVTADSGGDVVTWNPAAERLFGYAESEIVGRSLTTLVPQRFHKAHEAGISRVVETGETRIIGQTVEVWGLHKDGSEFPIELSLATWVDGGKRFFSGIIRDISERSAMMRALSVSEQRLDAILQSASDAVVSIDASGQVVLWNPRAAEMFGHQPDEMLGKTLDAIIPERFRAAHVEGIRRVGSGGDQHVIGNTVELWGLRNDGTEFPIELSLATWDVDGDRFYSGIIRDITERTAMMHALTASEQRLDAILQSASDAVVSIDSTGKVVLWNQTATDMFGYKAEEMLGETLEAIIPDRFRSDHVEGLERVGSGGEQHVIGKTAELAAIDRDGREFPIELSLATWLVDGERYYSGIVRDITERKVAEHALHLANKSLNEKNEQLEALSAKLAKYLSRQVYDSIFEGRTEVKVESYRKELTVFFSDIEGFTDLTDRLEAEQISEILNSYLSEMARIADECGGTIDKFIGDGIMIFFGDPGTMGRKADALACVRMALRMRKRTQELCAEWEDRVGPEPMHARMGINTGYCTVGNFGSEDRLDYTIVGAAVNTASRLESTARPDQIQISHSTYTLIKDEIYCRPLGDQGLKGISHPLRSYEVVGEFSDMNMENLIEAKFGDFNLTLDPSSLDPEAAARAREALKSALAALDGDTDLTQID